VSARDNRDPNGILRETQNCSNLHSATKVISSRNKYNIDPNLEHFSGIVPAAIHNTVWTSLVDLAAGTMGAVDIAPENSIR